MSRSFELRVSNYASRLTGWVAMHERTSRNQANGSVRQRVQVPMKLNRRAAVLPPLPLPKKLRFQVPIGTSIRSVAPLSFFKSPSS